MILVDSSVWIAHLRANDERLVALLETGEVSMHPLVIGELACGSLRDRALRLRQWRTIPALMPVSHDEALQFIERHRLMGVGVGFIDVHLLAAVASQPGTLLWTRDRRLEDVARALGTAFRALDA